MNILKMYKYTNLNGEKIETQDFSNVPLDCTFLYSSGSKNNFDFLNFKNLKTVSLLNFTGEIINLGEVSEFSCVFSSIKNLPSSNKLTKLTCKNSKIEEINGFPNLEICELESLPNLKKIGFLPSLKSLRLHHSTPTVIEKCENLISFSCMNSFIQEIPNYNKLENLEINNCPEIKKLLPSNTLNNLSCKNCSFVIPEFILLDSFECENCDKVVSLLIGSENVIIKNCDNLNDIKILGLINLKLDNCKKLIRIILIKTVGIIQNFEINNCPELISVFADKEIEYALKSTVNKCPKAFLSESLRSKTANSTILGILETVLKNYIGIKNVS